VILALGFYPHFIVRRTEAATVSRVFRAAALAHYGSRPIPVSALTHGRGEAP